MRQAVRKAVSALTARQRWAWILPVAIAFVIRAGPIRIETLIGGLLALGLATLVFRAPGRGLLVLVAVLPFQNAVLALLYHWGAPAVALHPLAGWKEVIVVGLLASGVQAAVREGHRLDRLDKLAIGYLLVTFAYLLFPKGLVGPPQAGFPGVPLDLTTRIFAFRADVLFVLIFFGARHAPISEGTRRAFVRTALVTGSLVAGVGIFEFFFSSAWNDFALHTLGVARYSTEVLGHWLDPTDIRSYLEIGGRKLTRPGSVFINPLALGFYLLVGVGLALEEIVRPRARPAVYVAAGIMGTALLLSYVRSAVLAALVMGLAALRQRSGEMRTNRVRLSLVLVAALTLAIPAAASTGLTQRTGELVSGDLATSAHVTGIQAGIDELWARPLGRGLGTQPGIGDRFDVRGRLTNESAYIQVGTELGVLAMGLFIWLLFGVIHRLGQVSDADRASHFASGLRLTAIGLAVGGLFLHVWLDVSVSTAVWGGAGMAIGCVERRRRFSDPALPRRSLAGV
jgi:hypothetical protein